MSEGHNFGSVLDEASIINVIIIIYHSLDMKIVVKATSIEIVKSTITLIQILEIFSHTISSIKDLRFL